MWPATDFLHPVFSSLLFFFLGARHHRGLGERGSAVAAKLGLRMVLLPARLTLDTIGRGHGGRHTGGRGTAAAARGVGRALGARYKIGVYDAMIVAAALVQGCDRLMSEDMHDGLVIEGALIVENPFLEL